MLAGFAIAPFSIVFMLETGFARRVATHEEQRGEPDRVVPFVVAALVVAG